jgi:predicted esterase
VYFRGRGNGKTGAVSPIAQVDKLKVPVLLAHGKADQRVPIKQSALSVKALAAAGKPYEMSPMTTRGTASRTPSTSRVSSTGSEPS